jgi:two-component system response regulator FixJ
VIAAAFVLLKRPESRDAGKTLSGAQIYIIDDDQDVRASIVFMLMTEQMVGRSFAGAREFLDALPGLAPGCLLVDVRMPRMNGLDLLRELLSLGCDWPVVMMTGHGERELAQEAVALGAVDFVEKPFDTDVIIDCLKRSLQRL